MINKLNNVLNRKSEIIDQNSNKPTIIQQSTENTLQII